MPNLQFPLGEWLWKHGDGRATMSATDISEFLQQPVTWRGCFRILSLPGDNVTPALRPLLNAYLARYQVPDEFLMERDQDVNYAFGALHDAGNKRQITWMRLVSKSVQVERDAEGRPLSIVTPVISSEKKQDRAWFNYAFVLIEQKDSNGGNEQSTLLCFGAPPQLLKEFNDLEISNAQLEDIFFIFVLILKSLWRVMDNVAWTLADVFRNVEKGTLERAAQDKRAGRSVDFSELHNISKHQIYMSEAFQAAQLLAEDIARSYHQRLQNKTLESAQNLEQKLLHSARLFKATHLRLTSLEKRIANITSLAFNIVTQEDSRSMHTIALITLVFLPSTLIATIFSSSFFDFSMNGDQSNGVHLSSLFWVFWVISVPVTAVVVYLWWNFSPRKKDRPSVA